jgi:hypothetical protein
VPEVLEHFVSTARLRDATRADKSSKYGFGHFQRHFEFCAARIFGSRIVSDL